ncbi:hypothetical protein GGC63_006076 [Paenibacillus sp. OAS669]|nr:collagen-like protein [Paenibacillus sp. OAS669]MBE1446571.1 hypothetical protein [Paenibacillus sp. OAS669]
MYPYPQPQNAGHDTRSFIPGPGLGGPGGPGFFPGAPGGFPGGPGGFPPSAPPGVGGPGGGAVGAPQSPPPSFIPPEPFAAPFAVDASSIRGCLFRYVYIWQDNGDQYWMYLTHVGRNSISGFRWFGTGPIGFWLFFGLDLRRIRQFTCF